ANFYWEPNGGQTDAAFVMGPQYGKRYEFQLWMIRKSGDPIFFGPYQPAGPVLFQSPVVVTDSVDDLIDLSDGYDVDLPNRAELVIRWNMDGYGVNLLDVYTYHIYVRQDQEGEFEFLGRSGFDGSERYYVWSKRSDFLTNVKYQDGPKVGHSYEF